VRLTVSDEDQDRYGRLLRYVNIGNMDAGLRQIKRGFAIARYDSRDGYGYHPRESVYIEADHASRPFACPKPRPISKPRGCWVAVTAWRGTHRAFRSQETSTVARSATRFSSLAATRTGWTPTVTALAATRRAVLKTKVTTPAAKTLARSNVTTRTLDCPQHLWPRRATIRSPRLRLRKP
jgi:hypothetical protein